MSLKSVLAYTHVQLVQWLQTVAVNRSVPVSIPAVVIYIVLIFQKLFKKYKATQCVSNLCQSIPTKIGLVVIASGC